jgi:hypothetical protein
LRAVRRHRLSPPPPLPRRLAAVAAAAWAALTLVLLATPPPPPSSLPEWLPVSLAALPGADKLGHAALFLVQASWLHVALAGAAASTGSAAARRPLLLAVALTVAWGAVTEAIQRWVPGREADLADLVADVAGASLYAAAWPLIRRWRLPR